MLQDGDVVIVDAESHKERTRFPGGAADLWTLVRWNGFRPRAKGLDVPVNFDADSDSTAVDRRRHRQRTRRAHGQPRAARLRRRRPPAARR